MKTLSALLALWEGKGKQLVDIFVVNPNELTTNSYDVGELRHRDTNMILHIIVLSRMVSSDVMVAVYPITHAHGLLCFVLFWLC